MQSELKGNSSNQLDHLLVNKHTIVTITCMLGVLCITSSIQLTCESLNGQNLGFPLRPYFKSWAPFFKATNACTQ